MIAGVAERSTTGRAVVRPAQETDNGARCELFSRVAMETDLVLSVRRDPDFEALYRLQTDDWLSVVVELDGVIQGTGTIVVRDGYIGGARRRVGYLGDLRFSPGLEGRFLLDRFYGPLLEEVRDRFGCELFLTAVIASNERAVRALTRETSRSRRAGRPRYTLVRDFDIRSLHLLLPRRADRSPFRVRRAASDDVLSLVDLLDRDARSRPFGFVFSEAELGRRLARWPGLAIDSFYLAEDASGQLVGCIAPWDAAPVKRMRVVSYRGAMRRVRGVYDVAATLLGAPRLPGPGNDLRYKYVTHQAVPSGDPRVLRALLTAVYRDLRRTNYHFLSACAPAGDSMDAAFGGFYSTNLRAHLYMVALPDVDVSRIAFDAWPGFEMALV